MDKHDLQLKKIFCKAIKNKLLVQFLYKSQKDKYPTLRVLEPYLVVIAEKGKGDIKLVGYPVNRQPPNYELGHYLFKNINIADVLVLEETFHRLKVNNKAVYDTPTVSVICRVDFTKNKS